MVRATSCALLLLLAACAVGAPPGFSHGNAWTFPLVGPLEHGLLLTPVYIRGHGPYLFAIDPDAMTTIVDDLVVKDAGLRTGQGSHVLAENDKQQLLFYAEVLDLHVGTLNVERRPALVVKEGAYDADGRKIDGIIGHDVIADSLVFGVDRDAGVAYLMTHEAWKAPADAKALPYQAVPANIINVELNPLGRKLVNITAGGRTFAMHLDLGAKLCQLREGLWDEAGLVPIPADLRLVDETGTARHVDKVVRFALMGGREPLTFAPYEDKRWDDEIVQGTLGLDFFEPYNVWADWAGTSFYLQPRNPVPPDQRIERWGDLGCKHAGCVTVSIIDPMAHAADPTKKHPGVVLSVTREPGSPAGPLEVLLAPAEGAKQVPTLVVNIPAGTQKVLDHLHEEYAGARLEVMDASPFPRSCPTAAGCVDTLGGPAEAKVPEAAAAQSSTNIAPP
ncbi:MAG TPA: hypothetical protein VGM88_16195 [Kofleriaceae bacterium]|jgi:hypothetical protein